MASVVRQGMVVMMLLSVPALAVAQHAPRVTAVRAASNVMLTLNAGSLVVSERVQRDGFSLRIANHRDSVQLTAHKSGEITVARGAIVARFAIATATEAERRAAASLLAAASALHDFDTLMRSTWARTAKEAAMFRSAHSMLSGLRGDYRPLLAARGAALTERVTPVRARDDDRHPCWDAYVSKIDDLYSELESCLDTINPFKTAYCAYWFDFAATLALLELFSCL
jgi:hypothetical protein